MNYFELFGLPKKLVLDGRSLLTIYQNLQKQFHPDLFITRSDDDRLMAITQTATINHAYQTLKDPVSCAEYLLKLYDINLDLEKHTIQDSDFLIEQMELREELDAVEMAKDCITAINTLNNKLAKRYQQYLAVIVTSCDKKNWDAAAMFICKIKFIIKLQKLLDDLEIKISETW